jgi:hypothetical protein
MCLTVDLILSMCRTVKVGVATKKSGPAVHTVSESGTAFAGPAEPSMLLMFYAFKCMQVQFIQCIAIDNHKCT